MSTRFALSGVVMVAVMAVTAPAPASAVTHDKLAYLTFSGPVQIPGSILDPGTYRFRLANPDTSRNVLQVLSSDGSIVYAMFHTIPDSRTTVTEDPVVSFRETPAGVPVAVKSLFYGGEYRGYEFVYPRGGPIMTAEPWPQPEITYTAVAAPAPEAIEEPEPGPVVEAEPMPAQEAVPPPELPRTASPMPLFAVGGLATLLLGLGAGLLRRN